MTQRHLTSLQMALNRPTFKGKVFSNVCKIWPRFLHAWLFAAQHILAIEYTYLGSDCTNTLAVCIVQFHKYIFSNWINDKCLWCDVHPHLNISVGWSICDERISYLTQPPWNNNAPTSNNRKVSKIFIQKSLKLFFVDRAIWAAKFTLPFCQCWQM